MKIEVSFNMIYNTEAIKKQTGMNVEELRKFLDGCIYEDLDELFESELANEGLISIGNINVKYI